MSPNGDPTSKESRDRAAGADREALRDHLMDLGIGAILLLAAVGLVVVVWPAALR